MPENLPELIKELSTSAKYSHGIFGDFEERSNVGHILHETRGPSKKIREYAGGNEIEADIFSRNARRSGEGYSKEFEARIWAGKVDEGFRFRLIFNDFQGNQRDGSHTDYTLLVPETEVERIKPAIESHPEIMIKVFQRVFPEYDRSKGKLKMRHNNVYFEYNDPSQIDRLHRILRWK